MSLNDFTKRLFSLRVLIGLLAGAALGYAYFYFIGCKGGSCPMWASPWRSMLTGAAFGILLLFDTKSKVDSKPEEEKSKPLESDRL
jgi:Na+-transporting NADH:ubiquinone oxidoreductase subunit NqrB